MASQPAKVHSRSRVDFSRFKLLNSVEGASGADPAPFAPPFTLSESRRDQRADRAGLRIADRATEIWSAEVVVVRDAARIADVLTVQLERPAPALEPRAQVDGVVARQLGTRSTQDPGRQNDRGEVTEARADVAPGRSGEQVEVTNSPGVGPI